MGKCSWLKPRRVEIFGEWRIVKGSPIRAFEGSNQRFAARGRVGGVTKHAARVEKEFDMQPNKFIRTLLAIATFWAVLALYSPV